MKRAGLLPAEIEGQVKRALASEHRHVFRRVGPSTTRGDCDVYRCTRCPRIRIRRREAS